MPRGTEKGQEPGRPMHLNPPMFSLKPKTESHCNCS